MLEQDETTMIRMTTAAARDQCVLSPIRKFFFYFIIFYVTNYCLQDIYATTKHGTDKLS